MSEPLAIADFEPLEGLSGWLALHVPVTGSTNADLASLARHQPEADRLWLTAGRQESGKGRRGRHWTSPEGNLHASVLLRDLAPPDELGFMPLLAALAAHDAIAAVFPDSAPSLQIKWPNDILLGGAKCCGILLERAASGHVIAGFGVNVVSAPSDTPYPATTLAAHGGSGRAGDVFHALVLAFADRLSIFARGRGKSALRSAWLERATGLGAPITVRMADHVLEGIFEAVDADGLLLLRMADGTPKRIAAGDVFFARGQE